MGLEIDFFFLKKKKKKVRHLFKYLKYKWIKQVVFALFVFAKRGPVRSS